MFKNLKTLASFSLLTLQLAHAQKAVAVLFQDSLSYTSLPTHKSECVIIYDSHSVEAEVRIQPKPGARVVRTAYRFSLTSDEWREFSSEIARAAVQSLPTFTAPQFNGSIDRYSNLLVSVPQQNGDFRKVGYTQLEGKKAASEKSVDAVSNADGSIQALQPLRTWLQSLVLQPGDKTRRIFRQCPGVDSGQR